MSEDWVDDETMTRDATLARFTALGPELAHGPRLPAGGYLVASLPSFGQGVTFRPVFSPFRYTMQVAPQTMSA